MFKVTGRITMLAKATKRPVIKANPQSNSTPFAKGIKYVEATNPTWKALKSPVETGSGTNFRKKLIEANKSNAPIRTLTITVASFIMFVFWLC